MASILLPVSKNIWEFDPRTIPGCIMWIDSADTNSFTINGNNVVTAVIDKSVLSNAMTTTVVSPTSGYFWSATAFNSSYPAFFTTSASLACNIGATSSLSTYGTPLTIFVVARYDGAPTSGNMFLIDSPNRISMNGPITANGVTNGLSVATSAAVSITEAFPSGNFINCGVINGANSSIFTNGTAQLLNGGASTIGTLGTQTFGTGTLTIGSRFNNISAWYGDISEVLIYNNALSNAERQQVEGYLAWKWGMQSTLPVTHPYSNTYRIVKPFLRTFQPTDVSTPCALWFDGGDATTLTLSGSNVTAWRDKSGNANNINSFVSTPPTYSSSTGILTFTSTAGTGTTSSVVNLTSTNLTTVFYVAVMTPNFTDNGQIQYFRAVSIGGSPQWFGGINRGGYGTTITSASIFDASNTTYNMANTSAFTFGNTVTVTGITGGSYNGTGTVTNVNPNVSVRVSIASSGTPTSYTGAIMFRSGGAPVVQYYTESNAGGGPYCFFASTQTFNSLAGAILVCSFIQTSATPSYVLTVNGRTPALSGATGTSTMSTGRNVVIGASNVTGFGLGEVLFYDGALSTQDRQKVESYLVWKWNAQRTSYPGANTNFPITHPFYKFPTPTTTPFDPRIISGIFGWYDGADSTTISGAAPMTQWNDKSGNGYDLTSGTGPSRVATSNNPCGFDIVFSSGSNQFISKTSGISLTGVTTFSCFVVLKDLGDVTNFGRFVSAGTVSDGSTTDNTGFLIFHQTTNASVDIRKFQGAGTPYSSVTHSASVSSPSASYSIISFTSGTQLASFLNGTQLASSPTSLTSPTYAFTQFAIGRNVSTGSPLNGIVNEVVTYTTTLTPTQRRQVEGYLAWKWGLQSSLPTTHPYYKVPI